LIALLKRVSRSFYLSVRVLPQGVQAQIALGYLLARAADTIADTALIEPAERVRLLRGQNEALVAGSAEARASFLTHLAREAEAAFGRALGETARAEHTLLCEVGECLALLDEQAAGDRRLIQRVLEQLIHGMVTDLARFPASTDSVPPDQVVALQSLRDLDEYTYFAAGCVGEFWTELMAAHLPELAPLAQPELMRRGVDLGKALQLVNVVRDVAMDLRNGRCYWPAELLGEHGLTPTRLAQIAATAAAQASGAADPPSLREARAVRAVTEALHALAIEKCESAWPYVRAIPAKQIRLRLACVWPLFLALDTLALLARVGSPLFCPGTPVKVRRAEVYALTLRSTRAALADLCTATAGRLDQLFAQRIEEARLRRR
jgi:farnesyl-diphosphate farnesyltransferase